MMNGHIAVQVIRFAETRAQPRTSCSKASFNNPKMYDRFLVDLYDNFVAFAVRTSDGIHIFMFVIILMSFICFSLVLAADGL